MAEDTDASTRPQLGRLVPPYPVKRCESASCQRALSDDTAVFLFKDLETRWLRCFCEDCAIYVELQRRDRFVLVTV